MPDAWLPAGSSVISKFSCISNLALSIVNSLCVRPSVLRVTRRQRILPRSHCVLVADGAVWPMDDDFAAAGVFHDLLRALLSVSLGLVVRTCPIGMRPFHVPPPVGV